MLRLIHSFVLAVFYMQPGAWALALGYRCPRLAVGSWPVGQELSVLPAAVGEWEAAYSAQYSQKVAFRLTQHTERMWPSSELPGPQRVLTNTRHAHALQPATTYSLTPAAFAFRCFVRV